ncbi:MAG: hypothetical protein U0232_03425 [Thermomicrobiales bacterium]
MARRRQRPRYTPTTTFETFPFLGPRRGAAGRPRVQAIAAAAQQLVELRDNWLNPAANASDAELKKRTLTQPLQPAPHLARQRPRRARPRRCSPPTAGPTTPRGRRPAGAAAGANAARAAAPPRANSLAPPAAETQPAAGGAGDGPGAGA